MSFTQADLIAMQARLDRNKPRKATHEESKNSRIRESEIQDQIEDYLKSQSHHAWWDRKRMDQPTTSRCGVPDIIGVFHGIPFGIEVKRPGEKLTVEQLGELAWMKKAGARTAVVFSLNGAIAFFSELS